MADSDSWLVVLDRYLAGECTPIEAGAVEDWLALDPLNQALLTQLRGVRDRGIAATTARSDADVEAALGRVTRILGSEATRGAPSKHGAPLAGPAPASPRVLRALESATGWRVPPLRAGIAAAALALIGAGAIWAAHERGGLTRIVPTRSQAYTTRAGQRAAISLTDGTRIVLGAASSLRIPDTTETNVRDVYLDGRAYFVVRHDARHPFFVHTAAGVTEDLGTAFSVKGYAQDSAVEVVVADGSVALRGRGPANGRQPLVLVRGQLGRLDRGGTREVREQVDPAQYLAWTQGRLVFASSSLREALPELGRWYDLEVRLADTTLATRHVTGSFTTEPVGDVLEAIAGAAGLRVTRHGRVVTFSRVAGT
jgi:transmembrane sensor